ARFEQSLLTAIRKAAATPESSVAIALPEEALHKLGREAAAEVAACAALVGSQTQGLYKAEPDKHPFREITIACDEDDAALQEAVERGRILGDAVNLTRELVNRHPEEIF